MKEQEEKLSSLLNSRLVTDMVSYLFKFFLVKQDPGQLGFKGKGSRPLLDKRSGMFLQGGEKLLAPIFGDYLLQGKL